MTDYQLERLDERLWQIRLERPEGWPEPLREPNNVYLTTGEDGAAPTLINSGHPSQFAGLSKALREADVAPDAVGRVIHTSWAIDMLGGIKNFPGVDHFVASPDMERPRDYAAHVDARRREFLDFADELLAAEDLPGFDRSEVEAFVEAFWPPVSPSIDFIPIRNGHTVRAADLELEVMAAPGTGPGNVGLFDRQRGWLFCGDITCSGLPFRLDDVRSYLVSLERLIELDVERVLPNRGDAKRHGTRVLKSTLTFVNNFMSNAPSAMYAAPTLVEFVERNLGYRPDAFVDLLWRASIYRELMDELVRAQMIESEGAGVQRQYGTDVDDPREKVRKHADQR